MTVYDSAAIADAVDHAAALLSQAAADIRVVDKAYDGLAGVNLVGRLAVFATSLPWVRIVTAVCSLLGVLAAAAVVYREHLVERFDAFVTRKVHEKMQARLAGDVSLGKVRVRLRTVTVEGFQLGNPPTAAFESPFLVSMQRVHIRCNPLSLAGVRGRGNFIVGWMYGEVERLSVEGATVYVDEVVATDEKDGGRKKIRNFQNLRKQTAAQAAAEREAEEAAIAAAAEEKRKADEAALALAEKKGEAPPDSSFFGSISSGLASAQAEIDKQLQDVTAKAMELPGAIGAGIQQAGADVTNRLNALVSLLERVNQKPPEETEEEKLKKRKLTLNLACLEFKEWNIHILAVSSDPFKFKSWRLEKFRGIIRELARECAAGLLAEIISDFQQEILDNLTKNISDVGDGLLNIGSSVIGGVAEGGNMVAQGLSDTGDAVAKGLSETGDAVAKGLSDTGDAVAKGLSDTGDAVAKGFEDTSTAVSGFFSSVGTSVGLTSGSSATEVGAETKSAEAAVAAVAAGSMATAVAASSEEVVVTKTTISETTSTSADTTTNKTTVVEEKDSAAAVKKREQEEAKAKAEAEKMAKANAKVEALRKSAEEREKARAEVRERAEKQKAAAAEAAAAKVKAAAEAKAVKAAAEEAKKEAAAKAVREAAATAAALVAAKERERREAAEAAKRRAAAEEKAKRELAAELTASAPLSMPPVKTQPPSTVGSTPSTLSTGGSTPSLNLGSSASSLASSLASSPATSPRGPIPPAGGFPHTHLIKTKYLKKVFEIVDVDEKGKIKIRTFMKALGQVPKIGKLLDRGTCVSDADDGLMGNVFAKLEQDRKREVTRDEFLEYFIWER